MSEAKTILIVDDDISVLRTFSRMFERKGYNVETAETGKEALIKVEKKSFDVVLVDFRLPDIDGVSLLSKLREKVPHAIKIMITGLPSLETGSGALNEGADAYLVKPVSPNDLLSLIEEKISENSK